VNASLRREIATLEAALGEPRDGLPEDVFLFISRLTPLVNVDLLIKDEGRSLLTWRDDEFFGAGWHLPGGIIRYKESTAERARACARDELGADIACEQAPLLVTEAIGTNRTRGHHISLLFRCRLLQEPDPARRATAERPAAGQWRWHDGCPGTLLEAQRHYARFL